MNSRDIQYRYLYKFLLSLSCWLFFGARVNAAACDVNLMTPCGDFYEKFIKSLGYYKFLLNDIDVTEIPGQLCVYWGKLKQFIRHKY
jgi:hypothetical protein